MTRPKVEDDKRKRTAQACDSCKRRKQKCNGLRPCNTCTNRHLTCTYLTSRHGSPDSPDSSETKRRKTTETVTREEQDTRVSPKHGFKIIKSSAKNQDGSPARPHVDVMDSMTSTSDSRVPGGAYTAVSSEAEEEADNHPVIRMLLDPEGRLLYVGDTATLSFLQRIRVMVETTKGSSLFMQDPARHFLTENALSLAPSVKTTHMLPERQTSLVLLASFFDNTNSVIQAFDEKMFVKELNACYTDPLSTDQSWLCLLNLVLAIGLILATPAANTPEASIIDNLRRKESDQSDTFYYNAKHLKDPVVGFENADFWSVQALLLVSTYMVTRSKKNAAYTYIGMAVRSAYSLGLHREEAIVILSPKERDLRRRVWRSLFVLDRFTAISLGRPFAIALEDCSGDTLDPPWDSPNPTPPDQEDTDTGLKASVKGCRFLTIIIKEIYQRRKISIKVARELGELGKTWLRRLPCCLHWRRATRSDRRKALAILHVNTLYCFSILIFTRPFFVHLLGTEMQRVHLGSSCASPHPQLVYSKMGKYSEACVIAALHMIALIQNAFEGGYLPRRDPFAIYGVFSAALVVLSGNLAARTTHAGSDLAIDNASAILEYCAEEDSQAAKMLQICDEFKQAISDKSSGQQQPPSSFPEQVQAQATSDIISPAYQQMQLNEQASALEPFSVAGVAMPQSGFQDFSYTIGPMLSVPSASVGAFDLNYGVGTMPATNMPLFPDLPLSNEALKGLLDLDDTVFPTGLEGSSAIDDQMDLDALWQWPGTYPPAPDGLMPQIDDISKSAVPMFGSINITEPY